MAMYGSEMHRTEDREEFHDDIVYPAPIPFLLVHVVCLAAIWTGVTLEALLLCAVLYVVRMIAVTAGYHRYFSHRSFGTSRAGQFILACLAQSSAQRGILWWAAKHRQHHKHSDTEFDVHSPRHRGFWYAHLGWIFAPKQGETDLSAVPDLAKYPELVWLDRHRYLPAILLGVVTWLVASWPGLVVGFFWSTVLLYHGSFAINSLAHVHGKQRYVTGDDSRNNWWLALITMGEGWHNNHHAYMASTRQGFRWWEVDVTYYTLKLLSWLRIVYDLNEPPRSLVLNQKRLGRGIIEKVAQHLAATVAVEGMTDQLREAWMNTPTLDEHRSRTQAKKDDAVAMLKDMNIAHIPTMEELRERARQMFASTPSLDDIVARARELILEAVAAELLTAAPARAASFTVSRFRYGQSI
jgi:stearoyl-CoA desaturase (delta-9 desaturase)